ncbi:hypothetical protein [Pseudomonas purpurea]|uniref:hypothetical protein n=1 Tax=Pseudomonas purpurea TaxID=3136737 RepID=UPI003267DF56
MRKFWNWYLALLDNDLNAKIFDNIKNLLVCALLFAAGTNALQGHHELFLGFFGPTLTGWGLIAVSGCLMVLNVSDGVRKLSNLRYHILLQVLFCLLYLVLAVRIVEIVWGFRAE